MRRDEIELEWLAMAIVEETMRGPRHWGRGSRDEEDVRDELMDELVGTRWARRRLTRWAAGEARWAWWRRGSTAVR